MNDKKIILVEKYQKGNNDAGQELLDMYEAFIKNFVSLLYHGSYSINTSVKNFLRLLQPSGSYSPEKVSNVIGVINKMYSTYDFEDIFQDVKMCFIMAVNTFDIKEYKKRDDVKSPFDYFLAIYFPYILKNNTIDNISKEPLTCMNIENWPLQQLLVTDKDEVSKTNIDRDWVNGITCNSRFLELTIEERLILKLRFEDHLILEEIGDRLGKSKSSISRRINTIKNKLKKIKDTKEENKIIADEYLVNNKSVEEIGDMLDKTPMTIYRRLKNIK